VHKLTPTSVVLRLLLPHLLLPHFLLLLLLPADDQVLHMQLLKRSRRGNYQDGTTAADTYWFSLMSGAKGVDKIQGDHPPTCYYSTACEDC
jgi:hypothetical protein